MNNTGFKLTTTLIALLLSQSVFAGSHVRYLCQLNIGPAVGPVELTNEIIVVQSKKAIASSPEDLKRDFMGPKGMVLDFKMTRYKDVSLEGEQKPYEALSNLTRDQMVGESVDNIRPSKVLGGDVHFYHTAKDRKNREKRAKLIIKSTMLDFVLYEIFSEGEYFLAERTEQFFCHEPDFFETEVSEKEFLMDDQSADGSIK